MSAVGRGVFGGDTGDLPLEVISQISTGAEASWDEKFFGGWNLADKMGGASGKAALARTHSKTWRLPAASLAGEASRSAERQFRFGAEKALSPNGNT